jgi:hypothetical protein
MFTRTEAAAARFPANFQSEVEAFVDEFGMDWEEREQHGERFLSEWDFAPGDPETDLADAWDAWIEDTFCHPSERV